MEEEFLTPKDLARILKVSYMTVYRWLKAGKLKSLKAGKQYRINKSDLSDFLQNQ